MNRNFVEDCLQRLAADVHAGRIQRRDFLKVAGLLLGGGALGVGGTSAARAAAKELVLVNWGGDAAKA